MKKRHFARIAVAMIGLLAFVHSGHGAFGEELSPVMKKAKKIKRLVKQGVITRPEIVTVLKTGQARTYASGDDGDFQRGLEWPESRFIDWDDGTITDKVTGLMWTKNARLIEAKLTWYAAVEYCNDLEFAEHGNWRLPNVRELLSLIDYGSHSPALHKDHPFENVEPDGAYWSSTTSNKHEAQAWIVGFSSGSVHRNGKAGNMFYVWPVRRGR